MTRARRGFGAIRRLPSKRYQAKVTGPDGLRRAAPQTFDTRTDAEAWLTAQHHAITADEWTPVPQRTRVVLLGEYAEVWLAARDLKPRTRSHYRRILDRFILPTFSSIAVAAVSPSAVRAWHAALGVKTPTYRAHAYGLLKGILATAVADDVIGANPCRVRGASSTPRVVKIRPASLAELETIAAAMPARYQALVLVTAWCALRFGEATELRRKDVDLRAGVLRVRRAVVRVDGRAEVTTPKSDAGVRDVAIPPHLVPLLAAHLCEHAAPGRAGLIFPAAGGGHVAPSALYGVYYPARDAAGRGDLRWHDLRHSGAVLAASTGATLAELMGRLGHSTPAAALRYQHVAQGRDAEIARRLSALVEGGHE